MRVTCDDSASSWCQVCNRHGIHSLAVWDSEEKTRKIILMICHDCLADLIKFAESHFQTATEVSFKPRH